MAIPEPLLDAIRGSRRFVLTSHVGPDGDAIGSELGLARVLAALGKESVVWNRDPAPRFYAPLPGSDAIHVGVEPPAGFPDRFDTAIVLECPSLERCGLEAAVSRLPLLNIDHHLGNESYGRANWVDPSSPSLGAMIFRLATALGVEVDAETATAFYLTLVTDTGGFRFSNATADAFDTAADLVRLGARPARVAHWLFESQPLGAVRLVAEVLGSLELHDGGRIATVHLRRGMIERAGAQPGDSEGLIDYPRSIAGVEAVALFRELGDDRFKVSLRSRGDIDIECVARERGGGGHKNAAGVTIREAQPISQLQAEIVEALRVALEKHPS